MRELWNLGWVGGLTAIGFLSVYTARQNEISSASLTYAAVFLGVFGLAHIGVRAGLPNADPWLLPLAALLCALGLTEIYRLSPTLARDQSVWVVIGLLGFLGMVFLVRDHRRLEPYTYLLATTAVGLLVVTMAIGTTINGAKLWLRFGGVQVQPGEFAKLLLVVALASYLRDRREVLTMAHRTVLGVGLPAARHLGPLALMAGISLGVLGVMNDLGTALLLFGIYLSMIYVATGRHLYTVLGLGIFAAGSWAVYHNVAHVHERFQVWIDPWSHPAHDRLPDHPVDRGDRRRGHLRDRPGEKPPGAEPRPDDHPRGPDGRHLRRLGRRDGPRGRRRAPADLPALLLPRLQDRRGRR